MRGERDLRELEKIEVEPETLPVSIEPVELSPEIIRRLTAQVELYQQAINIAIKLTNAWDWTNHGGKPYLMASGTDKVKNPFRINLSPQEPRREERKDAKGEYYLYTCYGEATSNLLGVTIKGIGTCSSRDQFFGSFTKTTPIGGGKVRRERVMRPLEEIDEQNIKKKSVTNWRQGMVKQLLGLENITWEQIKGAGIDLEKITKVEFKTTKPPVGRKPEAEKKAPEQAPGEAPEKKEPETGGEEAPATPQGEPGATEAPPTEKKAPRATKPKLTDEERKERGLISRKQISLAQVLRTKAGMSKPDFKVFLQNSFGIDDIADMEWENFQELVDTLNENIEASGGTG